MRHFKRTSVNLLLATDLHTRLRSTLEFGVAVAVLMTITAISVDANKSYIAHSQFVESFALTSTLKADIIANRAEQGVWPETVSDLYNTTVPEDYFAGKYVSNIELGGNGEIHVLFDSASTVQQLRGKTVTIRPLLHPSDSGSPVGWTCRPAEHNLSLTPSGTYRTNIELAYLPNLCRSF